MPEDVQLFQVDEVASSRSEEDKIDHRDRTKTYHSGESDDQDDSGGDHEDQEMFNAVETLKTEQGKPQSKHADSLRKNGDLPTESTSRTYSTTSQNKTLRERARRLKQSSHTIDTPQQNRRREPY